MKVKIGIAMLLITASLYSIEYNTYELVNVKEFKSVNNDTAGTTLGELYYRPHDKHVTGPSILFVEGNMVISDDANRNERRLYILDNNLEIIKEVKNSLSRVRNYIFDGYILSAMTGGFFISAKTIKDFQDHLYISLEPSFPKDLWYFKSLFYHDSVLFIHDNNYNLWSIKNPGLDNKKNRQNLVGEEETLALINSGEIEGLTVDSKKRLFLDGELQTTSFQQYASYYQEINNDVVSKNKQFGTTYKTLLSYSNMTFLGVDNFNSYYWKAGGRWMIIFNNKGQIIEAFTYDSKKSDTLPAVSPEGDVYFLDYGKEKVTLYKVERQW